MKYGACPKMDRFFPNCFYSAIEARLKHAGKFDSIKKIFPWHSFKYLAPPKGRIEFLGNGPELNAALSPEYDEDEMKTNLERFYGVKIGCAGHTCLQEWKRNIIATLERDEPVILLFSMGYIKEMRQYKRTFGEHIIIIDGYDSTTGSFSGKEQGAGDIEIAESDMEDCFRYLAGSFSSAAIFFISPESTYAERPIEVLEVESAIDRNLSNLTSQHPNLGLKGLELFNQHLREYLESNPEKMAPFSIPGLWQFSHERKALQVWIDKVDRDISLPEAAVVDQFKDHMERCFKQWIAIDFLIEKCIIGNRPKQLLDLPTLFDRLIELEHQSIARWASLKDALRGSRAKLSPPELPHGAALPA
jgi:hypothetical protein